MKKMTRLIDFSQEYKLSIPESIFSTDFSQLPSQNYIHEQSKNYSHQRSQKLIQGEEVNYVFWTYEIGDGNNGNMYSAKSPSNNLAYSARYSSGSNRSIKDGRQRKLSHA
jgi:hypothetical protein